MITSWSSAKTGNPLAQAHSPLKWQVYVPQSNDAIRKQDLLNWPKGVDLRFPRSPPLAISYVFAFDRDIQRCTSDALIARRLLELNR